MKKKTLNSMKKSSSSEKKNRRQETLFKRPAPVFWSVGTALLPGWCRPHTEKDNHAGLPSQPGKCWIQTGAENSEPLKNTEFRQILSTEEEEKRWAREEIQPTNELYFGMLRAKGLYGSNPTLTESEDLLHFVTEPSLWRQVPLYFWP